MRVYLFSALTYAGRLGNQLWQVAATIARATNDLGSRPFILPDWEYRAYLNLPEDFYDPPEPFDQVIDLANDPRGPYFQRLSDIQGVPVQSFFAPSPLGKLGLQKRYGHLLGHGVALHVRRTDYLENPDRFPQLTKAYYRAAVELCLGKFPDEPVYVFSDDIDWCEGNTDALGLAGIPHGFVRGHVRPIPPRERTGEPSDIYDLWLMAECKAHIIANSTFSWWGAYLSEQNLVTYPDRWFGLDARGSESMWLAFPSSWVQLPC